jgi:hypothetical protein
MGMEPECAGHGARMQRAHGCAGTASGAHGCARAAIVAIVSTLQACTPLPTRESRAAHSSLGCMRAALEQQDLTSRSDVDAHCIAAGLIALRCSKAEAWLAGVGKELGDLFGRGDAEWRDLQADARGIRCALSATDDAEFFDCCASVQPGHSDAPRTPDR